ncbi:sensor histidine kinase [Cohnella rhizosphaerae]|uniref:Sensor histidine kinase n=1 Tax=Cohnella rhizosphaerae TaxID=1457232 RepID=A0A9X4KWV3_9BACL|nr:sensor histidine kinase [Cohnella rhizosphaerae]MDG0812268.1 sensor histidine kinase [Cohnella rhizosphaerae]
MRFHYRLMLYNTLIFLIVAYSLALVAAHYAMKFNKVTQLQQSHDVLNALNNYYTSKNDHFLFLLFPLYEIQNNYSVMSRLMEASSELDYENDPFVKQEMVSLLESIAVRDPDIVSVQLRKNLTGAQYVYNSQSRTLSLVADDRPFFAELGRKKLGRSLYGTRPIDSGKSNSSFVQVYGIAGTLGTANIRQNAGQILITYNTQALQRIYEASNDKTLGRFIIVAEDGEWVYDSDNRYGHEGRLDWEDWKQGENTIMIDGEKYFAQVVKSVNRNYIAANLVPKKLVDQKGDRLLFIIVGAVTAMAVLCAILYFLAGSLASRRVRELVRAMKFVGSNNLSYRIPLKGKADEFEDLAERFNMMCDELQETIHREYFSQLRKKNAELKALQAGLNPHFLYNTLEAIRIKAFDDGNERVAQMIVLLAGLYRSLVRDGTFIQISRELSICDMYIQIFSLRYASLLEYEVDVDPKMLIYGIPKNLLQPIIENYFVHGIREKDENNRFVIRGRIEEGDLLFEIEDNGKGMDPARLEEVQSSLEAMSPVGRSNYGIYSAHERIQLVYGNAYGIRLESEVNVRTCVSVRIPMLSSGQLNASFTVSASGDGTP